MIRYLRGTVIYKSRNRLVLDVQGVGYDVFVTPATMTSMTLHDEMIAHISESIREDGHDLYGFLTVEERDHFELLRRVSGVGPKAALAISGFYSSQDLATVIQSGDSAKLSLVPGIGAKLASKIILELKDKMPHGGAVNLAHSDVDTIAALESLGYQSAEIARILPKIPSTLQVTHERVTWALRHMLES